ncbi:MAG: peptide-methionine (S)-S-oxide reductase MsrA [Anaerolineales bacterium]
MSNHVSDRNGDGSAETATFGGGCFWCLEPLYRDLVGVRDVAVGYAGGSVPSPSYRLVCSGTTGHAEVIQVTFDPSVISYRELLEVFFTVHNPTTPNRQGPDVGSQYRSIILVHNDAQRKTAEEVVDWVEREEFWDAPVVTEIVPLDSFYRAEEYHQRYFEKNPTAAYCQAMIAPKVKKFRSRWQDKLRTAQA